MPAAASRDLEANKDREIVQERVFDAPRELVWEAWTNPKHVDQWWGPNGFRNETFSHELRVGGTWKFVMHGPDGTDYHDWIRYEEVTRPERLVYGHGDAASDVPHFHVTVTFTEIGQRTKVTMRSLFPSAEAVAAVKKFGAVEGGAQTLARLAGYLPSFLEGKTEDTMVLSRLFDAPVSTVFEAWSSPKLLARWWGPKSFTLPVCEIDFRPGGSYRMAMQDPEGNRYPFHGMYKEIVPNERIVFTGIIDPAGKVEVLATVTFVDDGGKTLLTVRQTKPLAMPEAAKGQTEGWSGSLDKLDAMLRVK